MPQAVATAAATVATMTELPTAACKRSLAARVSYQANVKPLSGNAAWTLSLKEKIGMRSHRQIKEDDIGSDIESKGARDWPIAHVRPPHVRSITRTVRRTARIATIVSTETAAPKGQSLALPNCA